MGHISYSFFRHAVSAITFAALGGASLITASASPARAQTKVAEGFIEVFGDVDFRKRWWFSDFDFGGDRFITGWRRQNAGVQMPVTKQPINGGELVLKLAPAPEEEEKPFFGAEVQRDALHHYGDYDVVMKAGSGTGVISSFFTYTGPHFGDPHHEIDVEIMGRRTDALYINTFVDGEQSGGTYVPLGFDVAEEPTLFRFEWREDYVAWFVRGKEVHRLTSDDIVVPSVPGKLFMNIWNAAPRQEAWAGPVDYERTTEARYYCVSYRPVGEPGQTCSDLVNPGQ